MCPLGHPQPRALHTGCIFVAVQRSILGHLSQMIDGCQFTVLAVPKDPNNFRRDFRVPLAIYNESVPLFLQFRSSIGSFPSPVFVVLWRESIENFCKLCLGSRTLTISVNR